MKSRILTDDSIHARNRGAINTRHTFCPYPDDPGFCMDCSCPEGDLVHQVSPNEPDPEDDTGNE